MTAAEIRERAIALSKETFLVLIPEREAMIERALTDLAGHVRDATLHECEEVCRKQHEEHRADGCDCTAAEDAADLIRARSRL